MSDPPRHRTAAGITSVLASLDERVEREVEILDAFLIAQSRGQLPPEAWDRLNAASARDDRLAELAFAFEEVAQDKRLKTLNASVVAEFMYRAAVFFGDSFSDDAGSRVYLDRALAAQPTHPGVRARMEHDLTARGEFAALGEYYVEAASHRGRAEQIALYKKAAVAFKKDPTAGERLAEVLSALVRLDPADDEARLLLEEALGGSGRTKDLAKLLEQKLSSGGEDFEARAKLLELYASDKSEIERALPHVEALLAHDPRSELARSTAFSLLPLKTTAARAAEALAHAAEAEDAPADAVRYWTLALEHARGQKRAAALKKVATLKQDALDDAAGAYEAIEAALALDAADAELLERFAGLARTLGRQPDAAKTLQRVSGAVKDPTARARLTTELGELLLAAGDTKRARAAFSSAISTPGADPTVTVAAARALIHVFEEDGDNASLADMLERIAESDPDPSRRLDANQRLAELATSALGDPAKAIVAWRNLIHSPARARAMAELEPLFEQMGDARGLAELMRERASETNSRDEQRRLLVRGAEALSASPHDYALASRAWEQIVDELGPSSDVLARWIPVLEHLEDWSKLGDALEMAADVGPTRERIEVLVRLGALRGQRLKDWLSATHAFRRALEIDPEEPTSRTALEQILAQDDDRAAMAAAAVLEPVYRMEASRGGLLRVLAQRALRDADPQARARATREALALAEDMPNEAGRMSELLSRALARSVASGEDPAEWLVHLERMTADPRKRADALVAALGPGDVDSSAKCSVATHAARAAADAGDVPLATKTYRRALAFAPQDPTLLGELDALLRQQGSPEDRLDLYRLSLLRETAAPQKASLHRAIAVLLRDELGDPVGAANELREVVALDPGDLSAGELLVDLLVRTGAVAEALAWLEQKAATAPDADQQRATHLSIAELAADHGVGEAVERHGGAVARDPGASESDLDRVAHAAERARDHDLLRDVTRARAQRATNPLDRIDWLTRLADVESGMRGDASAAAEAYKAAARIATEAQDRPAARKLYERARKLSPLDREATVALAHEAEAARDWVALPALLAVLVDGATSVDERRDALLRLAEVLDAHGSDPAGAFDAAARALADSPGDELALKAAAQYAAKVGASDRFAAMLAELVPRVVDPDARARLSSTIARSSVATAPDEAVRAISATLRDGTVSEATRVAVARDLDRELAASHALHPARRELLAWLAANDFAGSGASHAAWAAYEEACGDASRALALYREAADLGALVGNDMARLLLASGDVDGAITTMRALAKDRSAQNGRTMRLDLATLLSDAEGREEEALAEIGALLDESPADPTALGLAAKLVHLDKTREAASKLLERALDSATDPEARARVLRALLEGARQAPQESRRDWAEQLIALSKRGGKQDALEGLIFCLAEFPRVDEWWDEAERLSRDLDRPNEVAEGYRRALASPLEVEDLLEVGQRAVAFQEEWFEDPTGTIRILDRLVDADPGGWAFDRLKLLYDAQERWNDLFELYDRVLARADDSRRVELLEDAAQIAKDFAKNADRAIGYMEQLLNLRPASERLIAALERLYERHGRHRELISLLAARLGAMNEADARALRVRMANLWLDELGDAASALLVVEDLIASSDDAATSTRLLERILASALPSDEVKKTLPPTTSPVSERVAAARTSVPPPAASTRPTSPPQASSPPTKGRGKRVLVRQRAAAILRDRYAAPGKESDLARVLEVELEAVKSAKERIRRHREISELYSKLGDLGSALEHTVSLVMLEPDAEANRAELLNLATQTGRFDRMADVLVAAAEDATDDELRVELLLQAGLVWADKVGDAARAAELLLRVQAFDAPVAVVLAGARRLDELLLGHHREAERLSVLERIAQVETDRVARREVLGRAAMLASSLGAVERAISAWEACLALTPDDREALTGLVDVLTASGRLRPLVQALDKRASAPGDAEASRADRVQIAHILDEGLGEASEAVEAWRRVESEYGETDESVAALLSLCERLGRHAEVSELLERAGARTKDPNRRAELLARRGDVLRQKLGKPALAITEYRAALTEVPLFAPAIDGLRALTADEESEAGATTVLLAALTPAEDWAGILALSPHRLRTAKDDAERVLVLLEIAEIAERRTGDLHAAFEAATRALALSGGERQIRDEAIRLAELTGSWRALADALREIETSLEGARAAAPELADLRLCLGEVLETRLEDLRGALGAYARVLAQDPTNHAAALAAIRVATRSQRWDAAAKVVLDRAAAQGEVDETVLAALEHHAQGPGAWDYATSAMESAIAERGALPPTVARDLEARVATWHRDRRADADAAEAALVRALAHDRENAELLRALAQLQRRNKGRPLIESLLRLSQTTGGDLDLLREAAEVASSIVVDRTLAKSIIERSLKLATERWTGEDEVPVSSTSPSTVVGHVDWALSELVRIHNEEGSAERIVELYKNAAKLPFSRERKRALKHEAARVALERLGDTDTALALYAELFEETPTDALAASQLAELYTTLDRPNDLLTLRKRQIAEETDAESRADLRVLASKLQNRLGDAQAAIETLRAALEDAPRHAESAQQLMALLETSARFGELLEVVSEQAALAEAASDTRSAVELYSKAASIADARLADLERAEALLDRALSLELSPATLDGLARIREKLGDWGEVAEHLDRLVREFPEQRASHLLRLADAFARANRDDLAQARLEAAQGDPSTPPEAAEVLVSLYRRTEQHVPLAALLTRQAHAAGEPSKKLALLREASELYLTRCSMPAEAVPLLEAAIELAGDDRDLKLRLAEALRSSGREGEARDILKGMLEAFAGRRPKERAVVHFHMARLALAAGQRQQSLAELEAATRIDPANPEILRTVAELARDDGQLEKAERSYRALLAVVRRETDVSEATPIVRAEVLVELAAIAGRQGEAERSQEILESAFEAAAASDVEGKRLEKTLRGHGMHAPLARALEARRGRTTDPARAAEISIELAEIQDEHMGDSKRAVDAAMLALAQAPTSPLVHDRALALARKHGREERYVEVVLAEAAKAEVARTAGELYMRAAAVVEATDKTRAAELFGKAEKFPPVAREALRALDRIHGELGDLVAQESALARLAALELEATSRDPRVAADVMYRLGAVRLRRSETVEEGCQLMETALGLAPDIARAAEALGHVPAEDEPKKAVVALMERVGREPGNEATLLRALRHRALAPESDASVAREAAELALKLGAWADADALLDACETKAGAAPSELALWATLERARLASERGDALAALDFKLRAADYADDESAHALRMEVAAQAHEIGSSDVECRALEHALDARPQDEASQVALSDAYRLSGQNEKLAALLARRVDLSADPMVRAALRRERAMLLARSLGRDEEAIQELDALLDESGHDPEAGALLLELHERTGDAAGVTRTLTRLIEAAKDRQDGASVASLSLKLGALVAKNDPAAARDAYVSALDWDPKNAAILRALLASTDDQTEKADWTERLLELEVGPEAEALAQSLAAMRAEAWDDAGAERAYELGLRAHPASVALRDKLLRLYEERGERAKLASLYETVARGASSAHESVAYLEQAASIFRDELGDPASAARALRAALSFAPQDGRIFGELMRCLALAGDVDTALADVSAMLESTPEGVTELRGALFAQRATLNAQRGGFEAAIHDAEQAVAIGGAAYQKLLIETLERAAENADEPSSALGFRTRLAEALSTAGRDDDARVQLAAVLDADGSHRRALSLLIALEERLGNHGEAAVAYSHLVAIAEPEELASVAVRLYDASVRAGTLPLARGGLERAYLANPGDADVAAKFKLVLEATGAHRELAEMIAREADGAPNDAARFEALLRASALLLGKGDAPERATELLAEAAKLKPADLECAGLYADALIQTGQLDEAVRTTQQAIASQKGRRSKEVAALYHRLAKVERARANGSGELSMLTAAMEMDAQNGVVASELAELAMHAGNLELAQKALRIVTMTKSPATMSKAEAYARLGEIAMKQADPKRAVMLLKRAVSEDSSNARAQALLRELGA